ncbi:MAG TPA: hypothetical protein VFO10_10770, partial [Oligoflexus sp.]|uniref:hypothetical protein n=1 Tax=Oligoflexus sp. TaxID=1971216 RepID=UPI002D7F462C
VGASGSALSKLPGSGFCGKGGTNSLLHQKPTLSRNIPLLKNFPKKIVLRSAKVSLELLQATLATHNKFSTEFILCAQTCANFNLGKKMRFWGSRKGTAFR